MYKHNRNPKNCQPPKIRKKPNWSGGIRIIAKKGINTQFANRIDLGIN